MMSSLWSRGSGRNLPFFSNCFQQPPHFGLRSNGDAHKSRSDVFAPVAEQNSLLLQFLKKCGTAWPEICEKKISGARVSLHAKRHQSPRPCEWRLSGFPATALFAAKSRLDCWD